jgi:hypothetical protein
MLRFNESRKANFFALPLTRGASAVLNLLLQMLLRFWRSINFHALCVHGARQALEHPLTGRGKAKIDAVGGTD